MGKASREKNKRKELQDFFAPFEASHAAARKILMAKNYVPRYPTTAVPQVVGISVAAMEEVIAAGLTLLDPKPTPETLIKFAEATTIIHDRYAAIGLHLYRDVNPAPVACKAGCHWCCFVRVSIGIEEAYRVKKSLEMMEPDRRQRIIERLQKHVRQTDEGSTDDLVRRPRLCPMNEDGKCQVYDARAVMCRNHVAYDVRPCRSFVEGDGEGSKRINGFLQEFGRYVTLGSIQVLEHYGIDGRSFELADAVNFLWNDPTAMDSIAGGERRHTDALFRTELEEAHTAFIHDAMRKTQLKIIN